MAKSRYKVAPSLKKCWSTRVRMRAVSRNEANLIIAFTFKQSFSLHDTNSSFKVHDSPPPLDTPESGLSPVSRTQSVCSFGGQEEPSPTEPQQPKQSTPASPPWNLIPAKLAHGSLMLAALTLGTTGGDCAGVLFNVFLVRRIKFKRNGRTAKCY